MEWPKMQGMGAHFFKISREEDLPYPPAIGIEV